MERGELREEETGLNDQRKAFSLKLHRLFLRWKLVYPRSSTRAFIEWYAGVYQSRLYKYLAAGLAHEAGLDTDGLLFGALAGYGERLLSGQTPADIRAGLMPERPAETSITVTRDTAAALDATFAELSEGDTRLTRQDALETAVQAFAHAPALIRRALVHAVSTGENPLDALVKAVDDRRNWRGWLAQQGCAVCGVRPVELHHLKVGQDSRFRTHDVLLPVCTRHHIARPGDDTDAAHAAHQEDWITRMFGAPAAFWQHVALLYVQYAQESDSAQD